MLRSCIYPLVLRVSRTLSHTLTEASLLTFKLPALTIFKENRPSISQRLLVSVVIYKHVINAIYNKVCIGRRDRVTTTKLSKCRCKKNDNVSYVCMVTNMRSKRIHFDCTCKCHYTINFRLFLFWQRRHVVFFSRIINIHASLGYQSEIRSTSLGYHSLDVLKITRVYKSCTACFNTVSTLY